MMPSFKWYEFRCPECGSIRKGKTMDMIECPFCGEYMELKSQVKVYDYYGKEEKRLDFLAN